MNSITRWLAITILALGWPAFALAGDAALKSQMEQWDQQFNAGDAAGVAALYTEDAQMYPPGSDPVKGRAAIQAFWQAGIEASTGDASLETLELHELGDSAVEIGNYADADGDHGTYMVVWTKSDGGWLIRRDIWNSSVEESEAE